MFDFAWSELALIGVVALVAIGPKDMPVAIKSVARMVKKARAMAGEFQTHIDDLMKEADLGEMRGHLNELRSFNIRDKVIGAIDPDGGLRNTLAEKPFASSTTPMQATHTVPERVHHSYDPPSFATPFGGFASQSPDHPRPEPDMAPACIPPAAIAREQALRAAPAFIPPACIPPAATTQRPA